MKLTKTKLKELIIEVLTEEDVMNKTIKYKDKDGNEKEATVGGILKKGENHPAYKDAKAMTDKGGGDKKKGSTNINIDADPFDGDVGGPAGGGKNTDHTKHIKSFADEYEEILDKTTKSIEKFIESADSVSEKNVQ